MSISGIVIVAWNSARFVRDCLASIPSELWPGTVVVDNLSTDDTVRIEFARAPEGADRELAAVA